VNGTANSTSDPGQRQVDAGLADPMLASAGLAARPADTGLGDQGVTDPGHADTGVAGERPPTPGLAVPGPPGYGRVGLHLDPPRQVGDVEAAERRPGRPAHWPGRRVLQPRKLSRPTGLTIKAISLACALAVVIIAGMVSVGPTGASVAASVKNFLYDWETG